MTTPVLTANATVIAPPLGWNINGMEFDAWLRLNHNTSLTITQHPVETGANITDHSYRNQKRFSFDIGMTDTVNTSLIFGFIANIFTKGSDRSVNAYNALVAMQESRQLLTLDCKYGGYDNVLIESIDVTDDYQTKNALKATINLVQVFITTTKIEKISNNPSATNTSNRGKVNPVPALGNFSRVKFYAKRLGIDIDKILGDFL